MIIQNGELCDELHAKALYFAKVEALEVIDQEMQMRVSEINKRTAIAKKIIQKKQHQLVLNEISNQKLKKVQKE